MEDNRPHISGLRWAAEPAQISASQQPGPIHRPRLQTAAALRTPQHGGGHSPFAETQLRATSIDRIQFVQESEAGRVTKQHSGCCGPVPLQPATPRELDSSSGHEGLGQQAQGGRGSVWWLS